MRLINFLHIYISHKIYERFVKKWLFRWITDDKMYTVYFTCYTLHCIHPILFCCEKITEIITFCCNTKTDVYYFL
jgi:hypothetical protein